MRNLQNFTSGNFLIKVSAFILLILLCRNVFGQNNKNYHSTKGNSTKDNSKYDKDFNSDIELPFKNCWSFSSEKPFSRYIASDNGSSIYLASSDGEFSKINSEIGKIDWKTNLGGEVISNPQIVNENVYVVIKSTTADADENKVLNFSTIRALDRATGLTRWEAKLPASDNIYLLEYAGSIIAAGLEGFVSRLRVRDGQTIWSKNLGTELSAAPFPGRESIVFGLVNKTIIALSSESGSLRYKLDVFSDLTAIIEKGGIGAEKLFLGNRKGTVTSVNASSLKNKENWRFRNGAQISHIVETSEGLLISSFDNFLYLISENKGNLIWKKRFTDRISLEPLIVGNYAIVVTDVSPDAFILELRQGRIVNKISIASDNFFTSNPLKIGNKFIFLTHKGITSFSATQCNENRKQSADARFDFR